MAKGQKRGNREPRKPKQPKTPPKVEPSFGLQIKQNDSRTPPTRNSKR